MKHKTLRALPSILLAFALPALLGTRSCERDVNPIIFVHGGSGSGAQFESQAMRFESNGYPHDRIAVLEYDSSSYNDILPDVLAQLDALIAQLQARTGRAQVDLLGHSLGTFLCQTYLSTPERAANVAHYVNIDGASADAPPGGVPTLALWAGAVDRPVQGEIVGATNITIPNQEHIQTATSEQSFYQMYKFFRGHPPLTTRILPEPRPELAGRVTVFPENFGLEGATLRIWRVDGDTGQRIGHHPEATYAIGPDGEFGPFHARAGRHYEFAVSREGDVDIDYFYEPFLRSDYLVRLNVALDLAPFIESSDNHVALTVVRFKEFWGDRGAENDVLAIDGTDVINPTTAPSGAVGAASSAFFLFDVGSDGVSHLTSVPFPFPFLGFLTGADLYIPTQPPGTVSVLTVPRGDVGAARTVNVPNTPSTQARVVVQLNDFEQPQPF
jgi:pimeloyl-ACP methyl ester carboxylesterase